MTNIGRWIERAIILLIGLFILIPLLMVVWTAVQPSGVPSFPPDGFTLDWFVQALERRWTAPLWISLRIAVIASLLATVVGSAAAYGLIHMRGRGRYIVDAYLATPLLAPEIVISLALLQLLSLMAIRGFLGSPILIAGHILLGIPYVVRTVSVSLAGIRPSWTQAAADLGASPFRTYRTIVLPLIMPGVFAGALFSFIVSFNNVELSLFLITNLETTLPMAILNFLEYDYSPVIAAVGIIALIPVILLAGIAGKFVNISQFMYSANAPRRK